MPCLGKSVDFNVFSSVDKAEVSVAEVVVVQSKLDSNDAKSKEISGKSPIVRWVLLAVNKLSE